MSKIPDDKKIVSPCWKKINHWQRDLVNEYGCSDAVAENLKCAGLKIASQSVRRWYNVNEDCTMTLWSLRLLEKEAVESGLEPKFSKRHLTDLGYTVIKRPEGTAHDPVVSLMGALKEAGDVVSMSADALADGHLCDDERASLRKEIDEGIAALTKARRALGD